MENQKDIYFMTGESVEAIENCPFIEKLKKNGLEDSSTLFGEISPISR